MTMTAPFDRRAVAFGLLATLVPLGRARADIAREPDGSFLLEARVNETVLVPGAGPAELWTFGAGPPGTVLRVRHGEEVRAVLRNRTPRPLSLHWLGMRGPAAADGVGGFSAPAVAPGSEASLRFTPPDPGLIVIRPMVVGGSGEPSGRGLGGLLVVEERDPPVVDSDLALLVRDWVVEPDGRLKPFGSKSDAAGRLGNRLSVGGADPPALVSLPGGSRVRLRIANGCTARTLRIRFDGAKAYVIAVDGQPTETFEPLRSTLPFAPGTRYELAIDLARETGAEAAVTALIGNGVPLLKLTSTDARTPDRPDVKALPPNPRLSLAIRLENSLRRDVTIAGGAGQAWTVNGRAGTPSGPPLFTARRGQPVTLALINSTPIVQPVHLHGHVFRLLHAFDDGWEPFWLDTLQLAEGKTARISFTADNPGRWLISSSVLERFDDGLWTWFEVT